MSSAMYWLDKYHVDGLRVDAVASMLYLDYSRKAGEWIPNEHGGNENLPAISFLRRFNEEVYRNYPDVQTYAEESTAWPMVSRPVWLGGLGFGLKWDMGWMHDTLQYIHREPIHRQYHPHEILFSRMYRTEPALHEMDCKHEGFFWVDCSDNHSSIISFVRKGYSSPDRILVACNFTPVPRSGYRVGVPCPGFWRELINTDAHDYGGSGLGNCGGMEAETQPGHGQGWSLNLTLPPLAAGVLKGGARTPRHSPSI